MHPNYPQPNHITPNIQESAEQEDLNHLDNKRDTLNTLNTLIMMMTHLYLIKHKPEIQ